MKKLLLSVLLFSGLAATAQIDRSKMPTPGPAPEINIATPETFILKNGLKVLVVENHKLPRVSYALTLDNPPVKEGDVAGVSGIMSGILGKGSMSMPKDQFNEEVDYMGASMSFSASGAFASGLSKYSDKILALMADAAIHPNFIQDEFDTERTKAKENLKSNDKNVEYIASVVGKGLAYGTDTANGEFSTQASLDQATLKDVKDFYGKTWTPANGYLVIVGDVDFKKIKKEVTTNFEGWKKTAAPQNMVKPSTNVASTQINFVDMPNAVQSQIIVQNMVDLKMGDPDYFPALIANQILGGGGEARLFQNLREDKAYTYGAYSNLGNSKFGSSRFSASASVRNMVTDSSVVAFLDEIKKFRDEEISDADLKNAKARYIGSFVRSLEQPATVARFALNIETQGLPKDYYKNYLSHVNAVTKADVKKAADKYFMLDNARIVVVGKGSEVLENLEKVEYKGKMLPVTFYDKNAIMVDKPDYGAAMPEGVDVSSVLAKYVEAIGGKEKLSTVKSIVMKAFTDVNGMAIDMQTKVTAKNQYLMEMSMGGNVMQKQAFNGTKGYVSAQGQTIPFTEDQIIDMKAEATLFPELALITSGNAKLERSEKMDGKEVYVIKVSEKKTAFYDAASGLKVKEETVVDMGGQTVTQPMEYSDYKAVDGIMFPHKLSTTFGPQKVDFIVKEILINKNAADADFE